MAQILSVNNLSKSFAGKTLFSGVQFGVFDEDRIGFIGPNGAGKSTLLKILAGVESADSGEVVKRKGLRLAYLAQTPEFGEDETLLSALTSVCEDPHEGLAKGYELLSKFDLNQFGEDFLARKLSGGWQKKLALARELMKNPELFIFDEPTNHLDVTSILWLEELINNSSWATIVVTHDRLFLQRISNKIFDLDPQNPTPLTSYSGDYLTYMENKDILLAGQRAREDRLKNTLSRETEWLRRGAKARLTKQKARIDRAGDLAEEVSLLRDKNKARQAGIEFSGAERNPKKLIEIKNLTKKINNRILFKDLSYIVGPQTRLALLGDNGCGKSTLIKILVGQSRPDSGSVDRADKLQIAYFEQGRDTLKPEESVLKNICPSGDHVDFQGQFVHVRSYLERFLFFKDQHDQPVKKLSGGEQARLRIAQLMLQKAQVLILDEPTNDLDLRTLSVLQGALEEFNGAVILVTHDRFFMDSAASEILAFIPISPYENKIEKFSGYYQWERWYAEQGSNQGKGKAQSSGGEAPSAGAEAPKRKLSNKEKYEFENIESKIQELESQLSHLEKQSADRGDAKVAQEHYQKIGELHAQIEKMYARWSELEALVK